jgi:hypothetical protein
MSQEWANESDAIDALRFDRSCEGSNFPPPVQLSSSIDDE